MPEAAPAKTDSAAPTLPAAATPGQEMPAAKSETTVSKAPPRQADPQLVERIFKAAATSGPADVANGMKKIGAAFTAYAETHNQSFPTIDGEGKPPEGTKPSPFPGATPGEAKISNGLSWRVMILPQLGFDQLYREFHLDEAWDSPNNKPLVEKMPSVFGNDSSGKTRLHLLTGPGTPFQAGVAPALKDFTDGLSITLTVVEAGPDKTEEWTKPDDLKFDPQSPARCLGEIDGSFLALTADGVLHRIPADTDQLAHLIQHQDRQVISSDFLKETEQAAKAGFATIPQELPPLVAVDKTFDPKFIPADTSAVIIISPRRILESKFAQALLKEFALPDETPAATLRRLTKEQAGLPIQATEEIRLIPDTTMRAGPAFSPVPAAQKPSSELPPGVAGIYLRAAIPLPLETMIQEAATNAENVDVEVVNGIPHVWLRGLKFALAFPSDHEAILATNEMLPKMTAPRADAPTATNSPEGEPKSAGVVGEVQAMSPAMIILAASAPQNGKLEFMQQLLAAAGPVMLIAPQLAETNAIRVAIDLESAEFLRLSLGFPKEDVAKTFSGVATGLLAQALTQGKQLQGTLQPDDPEQKAQSELLSEVMNGAAVSSEGNLVSLVIQQPKHLEEVVTAFQKQIKAIQQQTLPAEALPPMERIAKALVAYSEEKGHFPASNGMGEEETKTKESRSSRNTRFGQNQQPPSQNSDFAPPPAALVPGSPQRTSEEEKVDAAIARNRGLSWRVYLLPFLGEQTLYQQFHLDERWDSPHNKALINQMPAVFGTNAEGKTRIQMLVGNETLFKSGKAPDVDSLKDDPAQTIVLIETGDDKANIWTKPGGLPFDPKNPTRCLGKPDDGQADYQTLMLDWSVSKIPVKISDDEFRSLVQPSDGKPARKDQ